MRTAWPDFTVVSCQGTSVERDLLAGAARAVHWPNVYKPKLQLCLRLHAAGWQWSGGFAVDTPGDLFVKIRHRSGNLPSLAAAAACTLRHLMECADACTVLASAAGAHQPQVVLVHTSSSDLGKTGTQPHQAHGQTSTVSCLCVTSP